MDHGVSVIMRVHFANVSSILLSISLSLIAENKPEEAYFTDICLHNYLSATSVPLSYSN